MVRTRLMRRSCKALPWSVSTVSRPMASLIAARYEGVLDLTNADLARIIVTQYAHALGFSDAEIKDLIDSSYDAFRKMSIHVGDNFTLISG